jgi:glucosamine--fructose-6-phosphate aminotransferase (isomerizing)
MCGIVGYIGERKAQDVLLKGLSRLEYRGYDSAGIAVLNDGAIGMAKRKGKLKVLVEEVSSSPISGTAGIGHTRWATHGVPSDANAHPHCDCTGKIALVHNGIIENYLDLKGHLKRKGHKFVSETDTEVIAHLIEEHYHKDLEAADAAPRGG